MFDAREGELLLVRKDWVKPRTGLTLTRPPVAKEKVTITDGMFKDTRGVIVDTLKDSYIVRVS